MSQIEVVPSTSRHNNIDKTQELCFVTSKRGGEILLNDGYQYYKKKDNKNGSSRWNCKYKSKCRGTITIKGNTIMNKVSHSKNCVRDHAGNEIKKEISTWKVESGQGVLPLQTIYNEGVNRLKDRGLNLLTRIPNFNNVKHGLYNSRRKEFGIDNIKPKTVTDVKVPVKYNDFLMADYQEGARRILIFSSKEAREKLKTVKHFFADGTFKCVVPPFVQMYSIHGDLGSTEKSTNIKPLIYALVTDKKEETYQIIFQLLLSQNPSWKPEKFTTDFETAQMNAIQSVFPEVDIKGCFFHFTQALSKKAKSLHILKNRACKRHVALCAALALLPEQATDEGWFYIMEDWSEQNENLVKFNDYFTKQWLQKEDMRRIWCFNSERHRTTNSVEAWHSSINKKLCGNTKPNILQFLSIIKTDASMTSLTIAKLENGHQILNKRKEYIEKDEKIAYILEQLDNNYINVGHCLEKLLTYVF